VGIFSFLRRGKRRAADELNTLLEGYDLPSFPQVVVSALGTLRDPNASMLDAARVLQRDPNLQVKLLQTVNSAAFALASKVSNLQRAATLLGRSRLEAIVLTQAVSGSLSRVDVRGFDMEQFWLASSRRAFLARGLASLLHPATKVESFTAGLLQDMAVPLLAQTHAERYPAILTQWEQADDARLDMLERVRLGHDHPLVGALMAARWQLPHVLVQSIASHHEDSDDAVAFVSRLKMRHDAGAWTRLAQEAVARFDLTPQQVEQIFSVALQQADELSHILGHG